MFKLIDYFNESEVIADDCDIVTVNYSNNLLERDYNISISSVSLTLKVSKKIYKSLSKIEQKRAVKLVSNSKKEDFILNPFLNLSLIENESISLYLVSPISLFNLEVKDVIYKGLIKKDEPTYINSKNENIFNTIIENINPLLPVELRILKINEGKSDIIDRYTFTYSINKGENALESLKRLCFEFSLVIGWDDGLYVKDIKKILLKENKEDKKCIVKNSYSKDILIPSQNNLVLSWSDKAFKSVLELMEENLRSVYAESGAVNEEGEIEPLKMLFEGEYYPEYSNVYKSLKQIETGFLNKKLVKDPSGNIIGILNKNIKTDIDPIVLIEDTLFMFKPYNEYFKKLSPTQNIFSKSEFYKKYSIKSSDKIYQLLESRYSTEREDWRLDHPTKAFLMLREYESYEKSLYFSFETQSRSGIDEFQKTFKNIYYIQVFASAHYRKNEYTMSRIDEFYLKETKKDLYLYVNERAFIDEEFSFRQTLMSKGYNIITFLSLEKLDLLKVYNLFNPMSEEYEPYLIVKEDYTVSFNDTVQYRYTANKVFEFSLENDYLVEISISVLDEAKKQQSVLIKTIWDTHIRFSYYTHFYIDNLIKLAIDGANKSGVSIVGFYTFYIINELPQTDKIKALGQGRREELELLCPRDEVVRVENAFKTLFTFVPKVEALTGIAKKKLNTKKIIQGNFKGKEYGGQTYFGYGFREKFVEN